MFSDNNQDRLHYFSIKCFQSLICKKQEYIDKTVCLTVLSIRITTIIILKIIKWWRHDDRGGKADDVEHVLYMICVVYKSISTMMMMMTIICLSNALYYPSSFLVYFVNNFFDFFGVSFSQFWCRFTLEYTSVWIRCWGNVDVALLPFLTKMSKFVWTDIN